MFEQPSTAQGDYSAHLAPPPLHPFPSVDSPAPSSTTIPKAPQEATPPSTEFPPVAGDHNVVHFLEQMLSIIGEKSMFEQLSTAQNGYNPVSSLMCLPHSLQPGHRYHHRRPCPGRRTELHRLHRGFLLRQQVITFTVVTFRKTNYKVSSASENPEKFLKTTPDRAICRNHAYRC